MQIVQQCLVFLSLIHIALQQDCLNKDGDAVDWWFILKMPSSKRHTWSGFDYFYCDDKKECDEFKLEDNKLTSDDSPLMKTIRTINFEDTDVITLLWNDQPTEDLQYSRNAHSKGIMRARLNGNQNAFIISHSSPRFPKLNNNSEIDKEVDTNFFKHGQHFLCLSTTASDIEKELADLYLIAEISIYKRSKLPSKSPSGSTEFQKLIDLWNFKSSSRGTSKKVDGQQKQLTFETRGGQAFEIFSKNEKLIKDIYADIIAPKLQSDFVLESWVRQYGKSGLEDPECKNKYKTFSNGKILFQEKTGRTFDYKYTKDHSKYGITLPKNSEGASAGASAGSSFITTAHHTLKGQIFASNQHSRKREEQNSLGGDDETIEGDSTSKKRTRDDEDSESTTGAKRSRVEAKTSSKGEIQESYVCISDLNRQQSQWERGGLVYCFYNEGLWKVIRLGFQEIQTCDKKASA